MGLVTGYNNDVFISYSHIDNQPFGDPRRRMGRYLSRAAAELRQRPCRTAHHRLARQAADRSGGLLRRNRAATAKFRCSGIGHLAGIHAIRMVQSRTGRLHQGRPGPRQSSGRKSPAGRQGAPPAGGQEALCRPSSTKCWERSSIALTPRQSAPVIFCSIRARTPAKVFRARVDDVAQDLSRLLGAMAASGGAAAPDSASFRRRHRVSGLDHRRPERRTREAAPRTGSAKLSSRADRRPAARRHECARKRRSPPCATRRSRST